MVNNSTVIGWVVHACYRLTLVDSQFSSSPTPNSSIIKDRRLGDTGNRKSTQVKKFKPEFILTCNIHTDTVAQGYHANNAHFPRRPKIKIPW